MEQQNGHFVISLDFEIMWGVRDIVTVESYGDHLRGVQQVIPKLLSVFQQFDIKATFSTVGLLFFETKAKMLANLPAHLPKYQNKNLSPYGDYMLQQVNEDYTKDKYHFAPHLIKMIQNSQAHEIGTHTFSHYYCLEEGQTKEDFRDDINSAISVAQTKGIRITSIVFPRNQFNQDYLQICKQSGIIAFRNNENSWLYKAKNGEDENLKRRILRLLDSYINLTGYHCHTQQLTASSFPVDIPSSRFLRPYSKRLKFFDGLRMRRIKKAMTHAAKNKLMYHLWWHPHNFGINQNENFDFLENILLHYKYLNKTYNFTSITMSGLAKQLLKKDGE
jgi:peptidoglycan/xylan/chitin deacetylase (PgdA/CDA1 family)